MIEVKKKEKLRHKMDEERHLKIYGGSREEIGMGTYLHRQMDAAKIFETAISG